MLGNTIFDSDINIYIYSILNCWQLYRDTCCICMNVSWYASYYEVAGNTQAYISVMLLHSYQDGFLYEFV